MPMCFVSVLDEEQNEQEHEDDCKRAHVIIFL